MAVVVVGRRVDVGDSSIGAEVGEADAIDAGADGCARVGGAGRVVVRDGRKPAFGAIGSTGGRKGGGGGLVGEVEQVELEVSGGAGVAEAGDDNGGSTEGLVGGAEAESAIAGRIEFAHLHGGGVNGEHARNFHKICARGLAGDAVEAAGAVVVVQKGRNVGRRGCWLVG